MRGRDWNIGYGNQDGGGEGTVKGHYSDLSVHVKWDNGLIGGYRAGTGGYFDIKLAK